MPSTLIPPRSPNLNAHAERFVRSIKEECLDHFMPLGGRFLRPGVLAHYNHVPYCLTSLPRSELELRSSDIWFSGYPTAGLDALYEVPDAVTFGVFNRPDDSLAQAQQNKLDATIHQAQIGPDDHVLDVGCGWGSSAMAAARVRAAGLQELPRHHFHQETCLSGWTFAVTRGHNYSGGPGFRTYH